MAESGLRKRGGYRNRDIVDSQTGSKETNPPTFSGPSKWLNLLILAQCITVFICAIGYYRSPIDAVDIKDVELVEFHGKFSLNDKLTKGKRILGLNGPECIVEDNEKRLYTGLSDGRIVRILPQNGVIGEGRIETVATGVIHGVSMATTEIAHGRPLGMRIQDDTLYVIDAIYGFYKVDLQTKQLTVLVSPNATNPPLGFPDDLVISKDGTLVYFTDATIQFPYTRLIYEGFEGKCSGRLFRYNMETTKVDLVVEGLCFANGVQLTPDERTIIVAESTRFRLRWVDTKTWKTKKVLALPAMPDNIRMTRHETYLVATANVPTWTVKIMSMFPILRRIVTGLVSPRGLFGFFNQVHNIAIEISKDGEIINCWHDVSGNLTFSLTHIQELSDGRYALGSFIAQFMCLLDKP
uniref:Adipocyte plasma membrane-associated protein n=1 Tax=Phallusia mammillata TaxID=59560 RepID=A0A6F9D8T8_9ASCI|nr:adipocyte plasma membrane-associated protein [Phallusia mammillata]